jgi:hypothetical protein
MRIHSRTRRTNFCTKSEVRANADLLLTDSVILSTLFILVRSSGVGFHLEFQTDTMKPGESVFCPSRRSCFTRHIQVSNLGEIGRSTDC